MIAGSSIASLLVRVLVTSVKLLRRMIRTISHCVPILVLALSACQTEPSTYEECVLERIGDDMNDVAAAVVVDACRSSFPSGEEPVYHDFSLPYPSLSLLTGTARVTTGNSFNVTLYNGSNYKITEITIGLATTRNGESAARTYVNEVVIEPSTASSFSFQFITGDPDWYDSWIVAGARGRNFSD